VITSQILNFGRNFLQNDPTKNVTLYVSFYDDEVDTAGFTDYKSLEAFVLDKSKTGGETEFYLPL